MWIIQVFIPHAPGMGHLILRIVKPLPCPTFPSRTNIDRCIIIIVGTGFHLGFFPSGGFPKLAFQHLQIPTCMHLQLGSYIKKEGLAYSKLEFPKCPCPLYTFYTQLLLAACTIIIAERLSVRRIILQHRRSNLS